MDESPVINLLKARQQAAADHVGVLEGVIETWESEYAVIKKKLQSRESELQECVVQNNHLQAQLKAAQDHATSLESRVNPPSDSLASTSTAPSSSINMLSQVQVQLEAEIKLRARYQKSWTESTRHVDALLELMNEKDQWRERETSTVRTIETLEGKVRTLENKLRDLESYRSELDRNSSNPERQDSRKKFDPSNPSLSQLSNEQSLVTASAQYLSLQASYHSLLNQHEQLQGKHKSRKQEWTSFATRYIQDLTEFRAAKRLRETRHLEKKKSVAAKDSEREASMTEEEDVQCTDLRPLSKTLNITTDAPKNSRDDVPRHATSDHSLLTSASIATGTPDFAPIPGPNEDMFKAHPPSSRKLSRRESRSDPSVGLSSLRTDLVSVEGHTSDLRPIESASLQLDIISTSTGISNPSSIVRVKPSEIKRTPSSASATKWLGKPSLQPVLLEQNDQSANLTDTGSGRIQIKRSSSMIDQLTITATPTKETPNKGEQSRRVVSPVPSDREESEYKVKKEPDVEETCEFRLQSPEIDVPNPHISRTVDSSPESSEKVSTGGEHQQDQVVSGSPSGSRRYEDFDNDWPETVKKSRPVDPTNGMTPEEKKIFLKSLRNKDPKEVAALFAGFKGKGRYALAETSVTPSKTINEEFAINKDNNQGVDYAFNRVVRKRDERKQLHATDCECCSGYYEAVGALPPGPQGPRWRSPAPSTDIGETKNYSDTVKPYKAEETSEERAERLKRESVQMRKQQNSRHRADWEEPPTPPGYWNIGFPSSPEIAAQNMEAERMAQAKRARIEEEASRADGRYRRR